ncbi:MAG: FxDxF family PEP-CTERM protein [Proteobacteria bacterium]|nr:FxDxF family PEP-CTERM protein [Pseudomonadota bacterium]
MMMQLKQTVAAIALGLGFTAFAQAAFVTDLGELSSTNSLYGSHIVSAAPPTYEFSDEYTFSVANDLLGINTLVFSFDFGPGNGNGNNMLNLSALTVSVFTSDGALVFQQDGIFESHATGSSSLTVNGYFDRDPSISTYQLVISGIANGSQGGVYVLNMSAAAAVPEPAEYAMLLAGLGLVGMVARRRKINVN